MERKLPGWMMETKSDSLAHEKSQPILSFEGKIRFINNFYDCCYICEALLQELETVNHLVVGFDLEWPIHWIKPTGVKDRTALIQVCPNAQICYLFHVTEWKNLPRIFVDFISHPKVRLVGVNIHCDIWKLARDFEISVMPIITHNIIELSALANKIFSTNRTWSLAGLTLYVLKKTLNKSSDTRQSNWAAKTLTADQIKYAATDAYASLLVYQRLCEIKCQICDDSTLYPDKS